MGWTGIARYAITMALIMNLREIQARAGLLAQQSGGESTLD